MRITAKTDEDMRIAMQMWKTREYDSNIHANHWEKREPNINANQYEERGHATSDSMRQTDVRRRQH
jgi:hypothetical protein